MRNLSALCFVSLFLALSLAAQAPVAETYSVTWQFNVKVPMRDGVKLSTDIVRPDSPQRFPVILIRTPYNKAGSRDTALYFAKHGYVVAAQDVRGRHDSEGEWEPFFHEPDDGFDAQQWAATQPWSNGEVVTWGDSYVAIVQWLAAMRGNPHLKGMVSIVGPYDLYQDLFYIGGSFQQSVAIMFATFVDGHVVQGQEIEFAPWPKSFRHLPASDALTVVGRNPQFYRDWVAHPTYDDYWRRLRWQDLYKQFDFPVLNIGGWFDIFQKGTLESFRRLRSEGPARVRDGHRVIIGPWPHSVSNSPRTGDVDFGPESMLQLREITLRWLDHYIKGIDNGAGQEDPVKIFTMGEGVWHSYSEWPVPGTRYEKFYLRSNGSANTLLGDGALGPRPPPAGEKPDRYTYDPADPTPTAGGGTCCWPNIVPWGPVDQRAVERRDDVLVYSTPPLEEDLRVSGPVVAKLWIATSAPDTDFTVKLVDVQPNGFAMNLTDGILRARYRKSFEQPELLTPGQPYQLTIDLWNTSNVFKKGHRIRVEVSSSNFPRF
ncbi:MAG: CocE/NonD family hydrolase, partial [Candidatus Neomarinimicrobiota bacterium]